MSSFHAGARAHYAEGVDRFYERTGDTYRNPHESALQKVIAASLDVLWSREHARGSLSIIDLAAGSGEATLAALTWQASLWPSQHSLRPLPARRKAIAALPQPELSIFAADPYTAQAYRQRLDDRPCAELTFRDLAEDKWPEDAPEQVDLIICSYALHLVQSSSELWALLTALSARARWLVVVAPHKKPELKDDWGFIRCDPETLEPVDATRTADVGGRRGDGAEIVIESTRLRIYRSVQLSDV